MSTSSSYVSPWNSGPFGPIFVIPSPCVSTRWTLGRLNVGRYSLWKHGRLHMIMYQGFSDSAVAGSSTVSSMRRWILIMASMLAFSWRRIFSSRVMPSRSDRVLGGRRAFLGDDLRPPLRLPVRGPLRRPLRVRRPVVAHVDRRRRALEDVQLLGGLAEVGDDLHGAGPGADDPDDLVAEVLEVLARELVVPARGVERRALERLHAVDDRQAGLGERAVGTDDERGGHAVTTVRRDDPVPIDVVPHRGRHRRLEDGELVEVVATGDGLAVGEDLRALGVVLGRHVLHLVEQRQVVVGDDVAGDARIAVPVPRAADVGAPLDDADALDAPLAQPCRRQQGREPATDEEHLDVVRDGALVARARRRTGRPRRGPARPAARTCRARCPAAGTPVAARARRRSAP